MPKSRRSPSTTSRKKEHVQIVLRNDVGFRAKTTGLEHWEFEHNALPETNLEEISTATTFLGKNIELPLMVSCMTGGYADALRINRTLAEICEEAHIPMGVGSQRQAIENTHFHRTFSVVREAAPTIPVIGNIGAAEVAAMATIDAAQRLVEIIRADAFAIHLNPLQEFLQPEGNTNFRGVLEGISRLVQGLHVPVIVKEIGAGISASVARRLIDVGVRYIDVAGAGGTSWAGVEILRSKNRAKTASFWDWGIPTDVAIREVAPLKGTTANLHLIASGGIMTGLEMAKCISLGADLVASARPMLTALDRGGKKGLQTLISQWENDLRGTMFLTGSSTIRELQNARLMRSWSKE
jgi:isopentenyl-diphosphate Delta-isomerase